MNTGNVESFGELLDESAGRPALQLDRRAVLLPLAAVTALLVAWGSLAPISGAVVAAARIKVELERKTVQHREGGIVREIRVRNGQQVRAGDVLVVVDDVGSDAELSLLEDQMRAERVRNARVSAETTLAADFRIDARLAAEPRVSEHLAREREQFAARRRSLDEQLDALRLQMSAARAQSTALEGQIASIRESGRLAPSCRRAWRMRATDTSRPPPTRSDSRRHACASSRNVCALRRTRSIARPFARRWMVW